MIYWLLNTAGLHSNTIEKLRQLKMTFCHDVHNFSYKLTFRQLSKMSLINCLPVLWSLVFLLIFLFIRRQSFAVRGKQDVIEPAVELIDHVQPEERILIEMIQKKIENVLRKQYNYLDATGISAFRTTVRIPNCSRKSFTLKKNDKCVTKNDKHEST